MKQLVPNQFLFRFAYRCQRREQMPMDRIHLLDLPGEHTIPFHGGMDGNRVFADVRMAWNESGLGIQWEVRDKREPIYGESGKPRACDGLSLWLDTRDTRTIHRASRYCQRFIFAASDGETKAAPLTAVHPISRALEPAPTGDLSQIRLVRFGIDEDGDLIDDSKARRIKSYRIEVFLPGEVMHGFDTDANRRLGFFYRVRDREFGDQLLDASPELPYWEDPSLWSVLDLVD